MQANVSLHCDFVDIGVNFNQSIQYINENDKSVSLTIVPTKPLNSTNVTIYIGDGPGNASISNSKYLYIHLMSSMYNHCKLFYV